MKALAVVLCLVAAVLFVSAQTPCSNDDFYIYNGNGVALRIDSTNDHVHVCNNVDLCGFIADETSEQAVAPVFTEVGNSAYKSQPGSVLISGTANLNDATYDGLAGQRLTTQTFLWYGSKAALRAGVAAVSASSAWAPQNIGLQSAAFGSNTLASGVESVASGYYTNATAVLSTAGGRLTVASGNASTAVGIDVQTATQNPNAGRIKSNTTPLPTATTPGNPDVRINAQQGPTAFANGASAWGLSSRSGNTASTSFGYASYASGAASTAFGVQSEASGEASTAFGLRTYASRSYATTWGTLTSAQNIRATAFGFETEALYLDSTAFGWSTVAAADQSLAIGAESTVSSHAAAVVGTCNTDTLDRSYTKNTYTASATRTNIAASGAPISEASGRGPLSRDYAFQVGNGAIISEQAPGCQYLSSALTVLKNGDLYVAGNIYYGVGYNPYDIHATTGQQCGCLSENGDCATNVNSGAAACSVNHSSGGTGKRTVEDVAQLRSEVAELKSQIAQLTKLINKA